MPVFESAANQSLDEVKGIYSERGGQYADTWAPENTAFHFTREAFSALSGLYPHAMTAKDVQILQLASLIDVKISRLTGGYKSDTIADLIAYLACYKTLREQYNSGQGVDDGGQGQNSQQSEQNGIK